MFPRDATYGYTPNGSLKWKAENGDTTWYNYDLLGNLLSVTLPNSDFIEYLIDGQNRRVGKVVNGELKKGWLYQDQLNPVAEIDSAGNVISRFVYGTKGHVPDYMMKNDSTYRFITDHLGSVHLVVNVESGFVAQRLDYDEFGNVLVNTNPDFQPFGYAGGLFDEQTGLVRFGARDYNAVVGRWTAKDPMGLMTNLNLYTYVHNNPNINKDPFGLWNLECCNDLEIKTRPTAKKTKRKPRVRNVYNYVTIAQFTVTKATALSWTAPSGLGAKLPSSKCLTQERITQEQWVHGVQTTFICHDPPYWEPKKSFQAEKGTEYWVTISIKEIYAWVYWDWRDWDPRYTYGDPNEITYF